jgi:hypothetical protein
LQQLPPGALAFWQLTPEVLQSFQPERSLLLRCAEDHPVTLQDLWRGGQQL